MEYWFRFVNCRRGSWVMLCVSLAIVNAKSSWSGGYRRKNWFVNSRHGSCGLTFVPDFWRRTHGFSTGWPNGHFAQECAGIQIEVCLLGFIRQSVRVACILIAWLYYDLLDNGVQKPGWGSYHCADSIRHGWRIELQFNYDPTSLISSVVP